MSDKLILEPPLFMQLVKARGGVLPNDPVEYIGAHALWYYYISALEIYKFKTDALQYEDEPNKEDLYNLSQLHSSVSLLYGILPDNMNRYWDLIEEQAELLGYPKLPDSFKFNTVPEIRTQ